MAFEATQRAGFDGKFETLVQINAKALSSRLALKEFIGNHSNATQIFNSALEAMKTPIPEEICLDIVPGALEVLDHLQETHDLALVTAGDLHLQLQKMKKAGIQPERFSKLVVGTRPTKKFDYQMVLEELAIDPSQGIVCGDRVSVDLTPAKEIGLFTVHFRNGRGRIHDAPKESVDLTIHQLNELCEVFVEQ